MAEKLLPETVTVLVTKAQREAALSSGKKLNDWISRALHEAASRPSQPLMGDREKTTLLDAFKNERLRLVSYDTNWTAKTAREAVIAALSRPSLPAQGGEPVAWRARWKNPKIIEADGGWYGPPMSWPPTQRDYDYATYNRRDVVPLFAHPVPEQDGWLSDDDRKWLLRRLEGWLPVGHCGESTSEAIERGRAEDRFERIKKALQSLPAPPLPEQEAV